MNRKALKALEGNGTFCYDLFPFWGDRSDWWQSAINGTKDNKKSQGFYLSLLWPENLVSFIFKILLCHMDFTQTLHICLNPFFFIINARS